MRWSSCYAAWGWLMVVHLAANSAGCEVAVGGVGPVPVVVDPPVLDDHSGFEQAVELPAVEQLVAELAVERLDPRVLPRRAGIDEHAAGSREPAPVRDGVSWRTRARCRCARRRAGRRVRAASRSRTATTWSASIDAVDLDRQAFAGELVDHVEHLEGASVDGGVELEVERPQHVRSDRAHRPDMHADPGQALLALLLWDTQALFAPQPSDPLVVHPAALPAGLLRRASPPPPRSLRGELAQERTQLGLLVGDSVAASSRWWSGAGRPPCRLGVRRPRTVRAAS
jgi:hypothetical protein